MGSAKAKTGASGAEMNVGIPLGFMALHPPENGGIETIPMFAKTDLCLLLFWCCSCLIMCFSLISFDIFAVFFWHCLFQIRQMNIGTPFREGLSHLLRPSAPWSSGNHQLGFFLPGTMSWSYLWKVPKSVVFLGVFWWEDLEYPS